MKCEICNRIFKNLRGLSNHIRQTHCTIKEYYDKYLKNENEGICPVCGKETNFIGRLNRGYSRHCSSKCSNISIEIINKKKQTTLKHFGNKNFRNSVKAKKTKLIRYGDENYNNTNQCKLSKQNITTEEWIEITEKSRQTRLKRYGGWQSNETWQKIVSYNSISNEEKELVDYIKSIYNGKIIENDRSILNGIELDIYLPEKKIAFEFDGLYWHNELHKHSNYHLNKTIECEKQGIQLIHIFEDEWNYKENIVKSMINSLFNLNNKLYARKCIAKEIDCKTVKLFLNENYLQESYITKYNYGLFYNNELVSVISFRKTKTENTFELYRFCNKLNINVIGGASKLINLFSKKYKDKQIIAYVDRRWSIGNLYKKLNFKKTMTLKPTYWYILNKKRYNKSHFQNYKRIKNENELNKTKHEIMLDKKIYRIYDCGYLKYEFK